MKKLIFTMVLVLMAAFLFYGTASAITGACSGCHTMHASQNGVASTPNDILLTSDCLGCHTGAGTEPKVDGVGTANFLAGGSFNDNTAASTTNVHNVVDLGTASPFTKAGIVDDAQLGTYKTTPPGWAGAANYWQTEQLKCAGSFGCHGSHDNKATSWEGIQGYHHSTGTYRFLRVQADNAGAVGTAVGGEGVAGYETGGADVNNHNLYQAGTNGISQFCSNCHSLFHGTANTQGTGTLWKRHPTDITLAGAGMTVANGVLTDYVATPFAFTDVQITGMSTVLGTNYDADNGQVMCLSCHRAHGSQYDDLLRFDYSAQIAGNVVTVGCMNCHYDK